jgi:hypothetical protein
LLPSACGVWAPEGTGQPGEPEPGKALLAILLAESFVKRRGEMLPTYRVDAPMVCAPSSSVELVGLEPTTFTLPA